MFGGLSTTVNREAMAFASLMALFYFIVISSQTGFSHHGRYILPAIAPMVVAISCVAASGNERLDGMRMGSTIGFRRSIRWLSRSFVFLATVSCFAATPHTMSFFNVLIGGSENGPSYLLHSNVDWGQDLLRLERWAQTSPLAKEQTIYLAYQELYNPFKLVGSNFQPWPLAYRQSSNQEVENVAAVSGHNPGSEGLYAISVNRLFGAPRSMCDEQGRYYELRDDIVRRLRDAEPIALIGDSIRVFDASQTRLAATSATGTPTQILTEMLE